MDVLETAEAHGYRTVDSIVRGGYHEADRLINDVIALHAAGYKYRISYEFGNFDDWETANRPYVEAIQQLIEDHVVLEPWTVLHYPTGTGNFAKDTVTVLFFTNYKDYVYFKMMIA